ncbi:MAG: EAL domain-containing protein [Pseudomonadales bacterium]|nr:EAL domain-containing protein [Pseudomonadales bacterium]
MSAQPGDDRLVRPVAWPVHDGLDLDVLERLASLVSSTAPRGVLVELTGFVAQTLGVDHVFVGELDHHEPGRIRTVARFEHGRPADNFTYSLAGSPCEEVLGEDYCYFPTGVQARYPEDVALVEKGIDSYVGAVLRTGRGERLGLFVVMHSTPLRLDRATAALLRLAAARLAAELQMHRAERTLDAQGRDRQALLDAIPDMLLRTRVDGTFLGCKPARDVPMLADPAMFVGRKVMDVLPEAVAIESMRCIERAVATGEVQVHHYQLEFDGRARDFEARIAPSGPDETLTVIRDVTRRRRAERRVTIMVSALEQTADTVIITDHAGTVQYVNRAFEHATGYTRREILGQPARLLVGEDVDAVNFATMREALLDGRVFSGALATRRKDGTLLFEEKNVTPLADEDGTIIRFIATGRDVTAQLRDQAQLREQEERFRQLAENIDGVFWMFCARERRLIYASPAYERIWRRPVRDLYSARGDWLAALHPADRGQVRLAARDRPIDQPFSEEYRLLHEDGTITWIHSRAFPIRDADGRVYRLAGIAEDVTERKLQGDALARLGRILDQSSNDIYMIDGESGRILQANRGARRNLGFDMDSLTARTVYELLPLMTPEQLGAIVQPLRDGADDLVSFETDISRADGSRFPAEVRVHFAAEESPPLFVAIVQDISQRREIESRLNYMAYYDALTGLPNRRQLTGRVNQSIVEARRHGRHAALVFIDLDRFKLINDSLGHSVGDALLKVVAQRLQDTIRTGDMVARVSGDEFIVLLADVAHLDDVARVADKLLAALAEPVAVPGRTLFVTASLGIATYPRDAGDFEGLFKHADSAMYHAKQAGRNNFQFFTEEMNRRAKRQLQLETALQSALSRREFVLHYQPQVELETGRLLGIEALLRWQHPTLGLVPPGEFIPLAEENGLIVPIGEWVLAQACRDARTWLDAGLRDVQVAVNVSSRQFQQGKLLELVSGTLAATGLPARLLDIELTESLLMEDPDSAVAIMQSISALGVTFSIDDFGIGYSSLAYLRRFPVTTLKIDRSFVAEIVDKPDDAAITSTIIAMAHNLNMTVVAEGVEDAHQLAVLRRLGCDAIQGYHFARPMALTELGEFLAGVASGSGARGA